MNNTCKEWIGNWDYVTFGVDTEIPYGLLSTDSNKTQVQTRETRQVIDLKE